jgi:hypothetical protein
MDIWTLLVYSWSTSPSSTHLGADTGRCCFSTLFREILTHRSIFLFRYGQKFIPWRLSKDVPSNAAMSYALKVFTFDSYRFFKADLGRVAAF